MSIFEDLSNEDLMALEEALNKAILYVRDSSFRTVETAVDNAKEIVKYDRLRNLVKHYRTLNDGEQK